MRDRPVTAGEAARAPGPAACENGASPGYICVKSTGGMGNRLLGVACAVACALLTKRRLAVRWADFMYSDAGENVFPRLFRLSGVSYAHDVPRTADVTPDFWRDFLATSALIEEFGIAHHDPAVQDLTRIDLSRDHPEEVAVVWSYDLAPLEAALPRLGLALPEFAGLTPDQACARIFTRHLLPRGQVLARVESFARERFTRPLIGAHIRHTDLKTPLAEAVEAIAELSARLDAGVFLATDSRDIEREMAGRFPGLVFMPKSYPENGGQLHSHRAMGLSNFEKALEAAVEMYLLARCQGLVRYAPSTFSRISWYASSLPPERVIHLH